MCPEPLHHAGGRVFPGRIINPRHNAANSSMDHQAPHFDLFEGGQKTACSAKQAVSGNDEASWIYGGILGLNMAIAIRFGLHTILLATEDLVKIHQSRGPVRVRMIARPLRVNLHMRRTQLLQSQQLDFHRS